VGDPDDDVLVLDDDEEDQVMQQADVSMFCSTICFPAVVDHLSLCIGSFAFTS